MISEIINLAAIASPEAAHGFNWRFVGEHFVNLIILLAVLAYYIKQPLRNYLIERRGLVSNEIEGAEKEINEAKKSYHEYEEKLKNIKTEINSLKETIRKQGETEREEILKQARQASEKIRIEAREIIELETARAKKEIRVEVVSSALEIAESIIREKITDYQRSKLFDDFIDNIEEKKWHR